VAGRPAAGDWRGSYVNTGTGQIRYNVRLAGAGAGLFADALAPAGIAETIDIDAVPGTTLAGTADSGIIFPRSGAGSAATNFTTPGMFFMWDRRPPGLCALC
jgi:hypothetical protein